MSKKQEITEALIALESAALERWGNGDPSGFLEICAPDVVYFDPHQEMRVDDLEALHNSTRLIWGMVNFDRFELLNPFVQVSGDMAVLTFNFVSDSGDKETPWNCTEVYRFDENRWQVIQTHWSYTRHTGIVSD